MALRRVVVTGLGAVTPLGVGAKLSWQRLLEGKCGIAGLDSSFREIPSRVAALVPKGKLADGGWDANEHLSNGDERRMATFTQYAVAAASEALNDASYHPLSSLARDRSGVALGSGIGSFQDVFDSALAFNSGGYRKVSPLFVPRLLINLAAGHISMKFGLRGPNHAVSTACTTGAHAIGDAARFIQFGDADVMIAGGAESAVHPLAMAGFARAKSLSTNFNEEPARASRPFDRQRCGFVIGEGAAVLVLEELEHARERGARIYAELSGYGLSADAHHITAPPEDGRGAYISMQRALKHAGLKPSEVDYVNAHATSTVLGDAAENRAIKRLLLGEDGKKSNVEVNISSSKGAIGHLLGAAGAVEALFSVLAVKEDILPPTLNLEDPDDEFDCNYVPQNPQEKQVNCALSNSFGFGGTNASLCFTKLAT